jgi:predicted Zn-dependent protease
MRVAAILLCLFLSSSETSGHLNTGPDPLFTDTEVQSLAAQQYQLTLSSGKILDSASDIDAGMVQKAGQRIFDAVKKYYGPKKQASDLKNYAWQVRLVDKKDINAFCLPGARIVVGVGMLEWAQNEGSLAVVLAHEIAHILHGHGEERLQTALKEMIGGKKLTTLLTEKPAIAKDIYMAAYGAGNVALLPPFSPEQEKEADKLGMILAGIGGYNPREAIVFWERMDRWSRTGRQPVLMSAHRYDQGRQEQMLKIVDDLVKKYYHPPKP